jgi:hypothetical protein
MYQDAHRFISPYQQSTDPGEEFGKVLLDSGFEVIDCECRESKYSYNTLGCLKGDCREHERFKNKKRGHIVSDI